VVLSFLVLECYLGERGLIAIYTKDKERRRRESQE